MTQQFAEPWFRIVAETDVVDKFVPTIKDIQRSVCARFPGVTMHDLLSDRRTKNVVIPRQLAVYLSRALTSKSMPTIGRAFKRDHTTAVHSSRKIERLLQTDAKLTGLVTEIREELGCPA